MSSISISYIATLSKGVRLLRQQADARQPHGEGECRQPPRLRLSQPAAPRPGARGHRRGPGDRAEARQHGQVPRGGHRVPGGAVTSIDIYIYGYLHVCPGCDAADLPLDHGEHGAALPAAAGARRGAAVLRGRQHPLRQDTPHTSHHHLTTPCSYFLSAKF